MQNTLVITESVNNIKPEPTQIGIIKPEIDGIVVIKPGI